MLHRECADELLTTTRAVRRRLDLDRPVPPALIEECIEVALQSPSSQNRQRWAFVVVTATEQRHGLAQLYRKAMESQTSASPPATTDRPLSPAARRSQASAEWLLDRLDDVPVFVIPCVQRITGDLPAGLVQATMYGSILPAAWSFMLAARARGLGSSWTTMHLLYEAEAAEMIGVPDDWHQALLIPVGFFTGTGFRPAPRRDAAAVTHWNGWGQRTYAGAAQ